MSFTPRLTEPSRSDKYWIQVGSGGYNPCIYASGNSVLPNCSGYAVGRFMEIMGATSCNLGSHNGGEYWLNTSDGYQRGQTPKLGAAICWSYPGKAGHIAIVEQINADGSLVVSESGWGCKNRFWTTNIPNTYKYPSSGNYVFQGFIYNPCVQNTQKIDSFISEAKSHINESNTKLLEWLLPVNKHKWTAEFVVACAKSVGGLINVIIPDCQNPNDFVEKGISGNMGSFIKSSKSPKSGDIILLRTSSNSKYSTKYECDEIGIVSDIEKDSICVIQGTTKGIIEKKNYKTSSKAISGYYRPNWSKVDSNQSLVFGYGRLGKFYDTENTEEDATIREVGFLSSDYLPTTQRSKIRLSVINYTTLMSAIMDDLLVPGVFNGTVGTNVILDGIENQNARTIIQLLLDKGLNVAAAIGIAANIKHESGFRADAIEAGYSFYNGGAGLCQWTNYPRTASTGRKTNMVNFVGADWKNNINGQVDFLWHELQSSYQPLMNVLNSVPNTEAGAKTAADAFVRKFEVPQYIDKAAETRMKTASSLWSQIVIQMTSTSANGVSYGVSNGNIMSGTEIEIPSSVNQSGISQNYTNYSYWFSRWANRTVQRQLADKWSAQGKPSNRNIATIDGFYLCAVAPKFGTTGDKISVVLEDNTVINCILADAKGADAQSPWGHYFGNGQVDIIEWESVGSSTSHISGTTIDLSGWERKKVKKIINAGKYTI